MLAVRASTGVSSKRSFSGNEVYNYLFMQISCKHAVVYDAVLCSGGGIVTEKDCVMGTQEIVELLCDIATEVGSLIGEKGAISVFRYAGKKMGRKIGNGHSGSIEDARDLVRSFFQEKAFMNEINLEGNQAVLSGCKIGLVLQKRGIKAGSDALCNFGYGLIDGVIEGVTGQKVVTLHVDSSYQDDGITCREIW